MKSNSFMRESHRGMETEEFAADKRGFSRIRNNRFRSAYIRVHPRLILVSSLCLCGKLSEIAPHRLKAVFDRFDRSGEGEAHVTFAVRAKDHARHRGHLGAVKQSFCSFTAVA